MYYTTGEDSDTGVAAISNPKIARAGRGNRRLTPISGFLSSKTVHFPSTACGEIGGDADCLQIAMQPTALIAPNVFPIALIYEPPGNCSWANFTQTETVGVSAVIEQSESTTEGLVSETRNLPILPDIDAFEGIRVDETKQYQEAKETSTAKRSNVFVTDKFSRGTILGLPLPGGTFPNCVNKEGEGPKGPGKGDAFVFLVNPNFLFWDTGILSNFRPARNPAFDTLVRTVSALGACRRI